MASDKRRTSSGDGGSRSGEVSRSGATRRKNKHAREREPRKLNALALAAMRTLSQAERDALPEPMRKKLEAYEAKNAKRFALRTQREKAKFLRHFAENGNISAACRELNIGRRTVYNWLGDDEEFRQLYEDAIETSTDVLEEEAWRRAVHGVSRPVFQGGKKVGSEQQYSDMLMALLLKGRRPAVYRERLEHSGPGGEPLPPAVQMSAASVTIYVPDNGRPRRIAQSSSPSEPA